MLRNKWLVFVFFNSFFISISFFLLFFYNVSYARTTSDQIIQGPFKTNLYSDGEIYFVEGNDATPDDHCQTIVFMLRYKQGNQVKKEKIDEYDENAACVELASVFFTKIHNQIYVFTIQKWERSMPAVNIYNDGYEITAYTKNKNGKLIIDSNISSDPNFSGIDGTIADGAQLYFKYKTAADVKNYLRHKYY